MFDLYRFIRRLLRGRWLWEILHPSALLDGIGFAPHHTELSRVWWAGLLRDILELDGCLEARYSVV